MRTAKPFVLPSSRRAPQKAEPTLAMRKRGSTLTAAMMLEGIEAARARGETVGEPRRRALGRMVGADRGRLEASQKQLAGNSQNAAAENSCPREGVK